MRVRDLSALTFRSLGLAFVFTAFVAHGASATTDSCPTDDPRPVFAGHNFPLDTSLTPTALRSVEAYPNLPGFAFPSDVVSANDGTGRLFVVEGPGRIRTFVDDPEAQSVTTWLDIRSQSAPLGPPFHNGFGSELGLLGLAFDPDFANPASDHYGEFYVNYAAEGTAQGSARPQDDCGGSPYCTKIVRYRVADHTQPSVDISTGELVMQFRQPFGNHNAGHMHFSPDPNDPYLYISSGDGGSGGDPNEDGQNTSTLLGAILRIDVRGQSTYAIPPDNPFADGVGGKPEIYHWGLRNPYRMKFDSEPPYDLWIGDVGQGAWEEVDRAPGGVAGLNFGWDLCEGTKIHPDQNPDKPCTEESFNSLSVGIQDGRSWPSEDPTPPVIEYPRAGGAAVVGGPVYRGSALPELYGQYVFADYSSGGIFSWDRSTVDPVSGLGTRETLTTGGGLASAIGEDANGELLIVRYSGSARLHRLEYADTPGGGFPEVLSETGLFDDVATLTPAPGMIEYEVAAPFWSDNALKRRWIALPADETIEFSARDSWDFPVGTVLVKHFALPTGDTEVALETRIFIRQNDDWLGFTYWHDGSGDAVLLTRSVALEVEWEEDGEPKAQTWTIPSPSECFSCHTEAAGRVLGVRTGQLNRLDPDGWDQLERWSCRDLFRYRIGWSSDFEAWAAPDDVGAHPQEQARAHLASNCAMCHQPEGPALGQMDMRIHTRLGDMNLIGVEASFGDLGVPATALRIEAGDHAASVLWQRMATSDAGVRMPRGTLIPDPVHVPILAAFIDGLPTDPNLLDSDLDGLGDGPGGDNCPDVANADQLDSDDDGEGDACDPEWAPDLFGAVTAAPQVQVGTTTTARLDALNAGVSDAPSTQMTLYLSEDATFDPDTDPLVGGCRAPSTRPFGPAACLDTAVEVPAELADLMDEQEETFFWISCADEPDAVFERNEQNNCTPEPVVVRIPEPSSSMQAVFGLATLIALRMRSRRRR